MNLSPIGLLAFSLLSTPVLAQTFHFDNDVVGAVPCRRAGPVGSRAVAARVEAWLQT